MEELTKRERDVAAGMALGLSNKAIAERMGIEVSTVKTYVLGVLRKSGTRNRTQAAMWFRDQAERPQGASRTQG